MRESENKRDCAQGDTSEVYAGGETKVELG